MNKSQSKVAWIVLSTFLFQIAPQVSFISTAIADPTGAVSSTASGQTFSSQGSQFAGTPSPLSANYGSCFSGDAITGGAGGDAGGASGGAGGLSSIFDPNGKKAAAAKGGSGTKGNGPGGCQTVSIPSTSAYQDCSNPAFGNPFDSSNIDTILSGLKSKDDSALSCQMTAIDNANKEVTCIAKQGQLLQSQLDAMKNVFTQNISRFTSDDQAYKGREGDRDNQAKQISDLLNGSSATGAKGLLATKDALQKLIEATLPQEVTAAQNTAQTTANQANSITQTIQYRQMGLVGTCFKSQTVPGWKCDPNGPDLSPEAYITCMAGKYAHVINGVYDPRSSTDTAAQSTQSSLQGILDTMISQTPLSFTPPTDATSSTAAATASYTQNNLQGIEAQYVSEIGNLTINGTSVESVVESALATCNAQATNQVRNEQTSPGTYLGNSISQLDTSAVNNNSGFSQNVLQASNAWTDAMTQLAPGQNLPLNITGCQPDYRSCVNTCGGTSGAVSGAVPAINCVTTCANSTSNTQVSCLNQLKTSLTGLYTGNGQVPQTMQVTSQFPDTAIPAAALSCSGVTGCVALLQQRSKEVATAKQTLVTQQQAYETQAVTSTKSYIAMVNQMMGQQVSALTNRMQSLNTNLRSMGVQALSTSGVNATIQYQAGDNNLPGDPKFPDSVLGSTLDDTSGFDAAKEKVSDQQQKLTELETFLTTQKTACSKAAQTAAVTVVQSDVNQFTTMGCTSSVDWCTQNAQSAFSSLTSNVGGFLSGLSSTNVASLNAAAYTGMAACDKTTSVSAKYNTCIQQANSDPDKVQACNSNPNYSNSVNATTSTSLVTACQQNNNTLTTDKSSLQATEGTSQPTAGAMSNPGGGGSP